MSLAPRLDAGPAATAHALAALAALVPGAPHMLLRNGTPFHRATGYIRCTLMTSVAHSSFRIHDMRLCAPFSPTHIPSIVVLINLPLAPRPGAKSPPVASP